MFLHVSVILFTGGVCLSACWDRHSWEQTLHPLGADTPPLGADTPPEQCMLGRYRQQASYWNAFLLFRELHTKEPFSYLRVRLHLILLKLLRLRLHGWLRFFSVRWIGISIAITTRLHSSRIHTTHLLTVSSSMHCAGGCLVPGGCLLLGVSAPRGSAWSWGVVVSQHALRQIPPVNRILDTRYWKYYLAPNFVCGR